MFSSKLMNGVFHLGSGVDLDPRPEELPGNRLRLVVGDMTPLIPLVGGVMLL